MDGCWTAHTLVRLPKFFVLGDGFFKNDSPGFAIVFSRLIVQRLSNLQEYQFSNMWGQSLEQLISRKILLEGLFSSILEALSEIPPFSDDR